MTQLTDRAARVRSRLIDRIARVDLRVTDKGRALDFYRDVIGLEVAERDGSRATLGSSGGPVFLTLDSTGVTRPPDPGATGLFHTAFRFPTRASLGDALARLSEARLGIGAGDHLVSEALYVDDPDGNGVELYWDRPVEQWPAPTEEMLVPMATLPVDLQGLLEEGRGATAIGEQAPEGTDVGHVHLQVSDIGATTKFYSEVLGLDLTGRLGGSAGFFSSNGYHHNIGANTWRSQGSKPAEHDHAGLERVLFAVENAQDLDALNSRLPDASLHEGVLTVSDPDGIELQFALM